MSRISALNGTLSRLKKEGTIRPINTFKRVLSYAFMMALFFACANNEEQVEEVDNTLITSTDSLSQQEAFAQINASIQEDVGNAQLYFKRAKLQIKYNNLAAAIQDVNRAIKIDSITPVFYLYQAELLKAAGDVVGCKLALEKCMLANPNNVEARIQLGWLALAAGNDQQAMDYADAALKRDVYSAETYYLKGIIFQQRGDTNRALSTFKTALEQENDYYEPNVALGLLYFKTDPNLAKAYFKNALRIRPNSIEALYDYALICQENVAYEEAIATYQEILAIGPFKEPHFNLGFIQQEYLGDFTKAIEHYGEAIKLDSTYFEAYYNRGLCKEKNGDYAGAVKDFKAALNINPVYDFAAIALERALKQ